MAGPGPRTGSRGTPRVRRRAPARARTHVDEWLLRFARGAGAPHLRAPPRHRRRRDSLGSGAADAAGRPGARDSHRGAGLATRSRRGRPGARTGRRRGRGRLRSERSPSRRHPRDRIRRERAIPRGGAGARRRPARRCVAVGSDAGPRPSAARNAAGRRAVLPRRGQRQSRAGPEPVPHPGLADLARRRHVSRRRARRGIADHPAAGVLPQPASGRSSSIPSD